MIRIFYKRLPRWDLYGSHDLRMFAVYDLHGQHMFAECDMCDLPGIPSAQHFHVVKKGSRLSTVDRDLSDV